jgi:hypothetical protein
VGTAFSRDTNTFYDFTGFNDFSDFPLTACPERVEGFTINDLTN